VVPGVCCRQVCLVGFYSGRIGAGRGECWVVRGVVLLLPKRCMEICLFVLK